MTTGIANGDAMADELELLKQQIELQKQEISIIKQSFGLELDKIGRAFSQMGNLLDLLYLEVSCMIDLNVKKGTFTQEEFTQLLEVTAKKVEAEIKKSTEAAKKEESPIIVP